MTYTKQVREYCETHKGALIDISKVKDEEFVDIHYKTLLKILNRLEEEDIVHTVSKGVYSICKLKSGNQPNVLKQYTSDGRGMVVGYMLYHSMGITNYHPLVTEIYTNAMSSAHKNIENYHLTRVDLEFTYDVIAFIVLLELLKDFCNIKACNVLKLDMAIPLFLDRYSDELFEKIIKAKDYPFSVITMLEKRLNEKGILNHCRDICCKIHDCAIKVHKVKYRHGAFALCRYFYLLTKGLKQGGLMASINH